MKDSQETWMEAVVGLSYRITDFAAYRILAIKPLIHLLEYAVKRSSSPMFIVKGSQALSDMHCHKHRYVEALSILDWLFSKGVEEGLELFGLPTSRFPLVLPQLITQYVDVCEAARRDPEIPLELLTAFAEVCEMKLSEDPTAVELVTAASEAQMMVDNFMDIWAFSFKSSREIEPRTLVDTYLQTEPPKMLEKQVIAHFEDE